MKAIMSKHEAKNLAEQVEAKNGDLQCFVGKPTTNGVERHVVHVTEFVSGWDPSFRPYTMARPA